MTWYVPTEEIGDYMAAGSSAVIGFGSYPNFPAVKNKAMQDAFSMGMISVQTDDDFLWMMQVADDNIHQISFNEGVTIVLRRLLQSEFKLGGCFYAGDSDYYDPVKTNRAGRCDLNQWVLGCLNIILPNSLRFDEGEANLRDLDYCMQHLQHYNGMLCCNDVLVNYHCQLLDGEMEGGLGTGNGRLLPSYDQRQGWRERWGGRSDFGKDSRCFVNEPCQFRMFKEDGV